MRLKLSSKKHMLLKTFIWISYGIYLILSIELIKDSTIFHGIILSGFLIQLSVISFIDNWYKLGKPLLLDWFRLSTFLYLILNFFFISFYLDNNLNILVNNISYVKSEYSLFALFVILVGLIAIKISEILIIRTKGSKRLLPIYTYKLRRPTLFYLFLISISVIQIYLMLNGLIGYGSDKQILYSSYSFLIQAIHIIAPVILISMATVLFYYKNKSRLFKWLLILFFLVQILFGFLSGMKENIILPIILISIPYFLAGNKLPVRILLPAILLIIILYPINNNYRYFLNNTNLNKDKAIQLAFLTTFSGNFLDIVSSGGESYISRTSLFPMAMYSIQEESLWNDYKNLDRYVFLPVSWVIPRGILPSKPKSDTGAKLYEMQTGNNNRTSVTPSTYGWSYFEGGVLQVFISFLIFGAFIATIEKQVNHRKLFSIIVFSLILTSLLKIESDIYFRISGTLQMIFISYFFYKVFFVRKSLNIKTVTVGK